MNATLFCKLFDKRLSDQAPSKAARGVLYIAAAKFYFMVAGMVIQFRLPHILSRGAWGSYSLVTNPTREGESALNQGFPAAKRPVAGRGGRYS